MQHNDKLGGKLGTMRRAQRALTDRRDRRRAKEAGIILGRHDYPLSRAVRS